MALLCACLGGIWVLSLSGDTVFANDPDSAEKEIAPLSSVDRYGSQKQLYNAGVRQMIALLKDGKKAEAEDLTADLVKRISEHRVDALDPWPGRVNELEQALAMYDSDLSYQLLENGKNQASGPAAFFGSLLFEDSMHKPSSSLDYCEDAVRLQMKLLQEAVEKYARNHAGKYPVVLDDSFRTYFPQITFNNVKNMGPFFNPFTKKQQWFEVKQLSNIAETGDIQAVPKGEMIYCSIAGGHNFAIVGGAHDGKMLRDKNGNFFVVTRK